MVGIIKRMVWEAAILYTEIQELRQVAKDVLYQHRKSHNCGWFTAIQSYVAEEHVYIWCW